MFGYSLTMWSVHVWRPQILVPIFQSFLTWHFVCSTCEEGFDPVFVTVEDTNSGALHELVPVSLHSLSKKSQS